MIKHIERIYNSPLALERFRNRSHLTDHQKRDIVKHFRASGMKLNTFADVWDLPVKKFQELVLSVENG